MLRRGVCSAERLLSVVGAEVWAEIRSCCGSCCCAAWLILHWTFFPLLTLLWSLLGADRSRLPAAAAAGTLLSQAAGTGRANKQWKIPVFLISSLTLDLLEAPRQGLKGHCSGSSGCSHCLWHV